MRYPRRTASNRYNTPESTDHRRLGRRENSSSASEMALRNVPNDRPQGEYEDRTIIVENINADYLPRQLQKLFSIHGKVLNLRIVNPHDPNLAGCSKDGLLARSEGSEFWGTSLGIYVIVEYCMRSQAIYALCALRHMLTDPHHRYGFRVGLRSMYSYVEPDEMDEPTIEDMEIGESAEPSNTNTREESLTEEIELQEC